MSWWVGIRRTGSAHAHASWGFSLDCRCRTHSR